MFSAVWRVSAMRATITHVIEVARNCAGCTSSYPASLALRHGAAWRTLRLLRGAGDESYLIAQAVYLQSASMCVSTEVRDGRPVKEGEATQGHECLLGMPENTYWKSGPIAIIRCGTFLG
jgi:hypothetical protein